MAEKNNTNQAKKTLLDMNASWPLLLVYLAYLIGIYFAQQSLASGLANYNSFAFVFLTLILGILITFFVYNGAKILFARLSGYRVSFVKCFGLVGERINGKLKFRYDILSILDVALSFAPVDDNLDRKPTRIFLGGFVGEIVLVAIGLLLYFPLKDSSSLVAVSALTAVLYGFIIPLYELMPFRQDYANDMFNLIMTRKADDRKAYNMVKINEVREFTGEDFLVPDFQDYDSYYRVQTLPYLFLNQLYANDLEKAVETLGKMKYLDKDMPDDKKYFVDKENVYLRFLTGDLDGANRIFLNIKSDYRKQIRSPYYLADFRVGLIACAFIARDKELLDSLFKDYGKLLKRLPATGRVEKEKALFNQVYEAIKKNDPNQYLPSLPEDKPA